MTLSLEGRKKKERKTGNEVKKGGKSDEAEESNT
jgi:hypothetical protein